MLERVLAAITNESRSLGIKNATGASFARVVFGAREKNRERPFLVVCEDSKIARQVWKDLALLLGDSVHYLEQKEELDYAVHAKGEDVTRSRLKTMNSAAQNPNQIFVMSKGSYEQTVLDKELFARDALNFEVGMSCDLERIIARFVEFGYVREPVVEGNGQFSVRGGIIDFSSVSGDFRIEFFGDEIESIREFNIGTQRSVNKLKSAKAVPAHETGGECYFADYFENAITFIHAEVPIADVVIGGDDFELQQEIEIAMEKIRINKAEKKARRREVKPENVQRLDSYSDLEEGDLVVHRSHGIGRFVGIKQMMVSGARADYLEIKYAGEDKLFVSVQQLDLVYKYAGKEGREVKLSKLGGMEWARTKQRVRKACEDIADQLIELYAKRQMLEGHAFPEDNEWQREFEDTFEYIETPDQLRAINEVKRDMQTSRPMDRLICGDVGYGKTEVAMRAAFKAVLDGLQVAYLVPTTVLAQQHYETFKRRMERFGVKVEVLSRFRTAAEQRKTLSRMAAGELDIVIGTHRLLQKDIKYKNLGLLIIDEEQRFGVTHKEKIKEIKTNVDVLTLTATPIPRTLHMSLVGIRDMSLIEHPPKDRYPVSTGVMEYDFSVITKAILKEVARGGQVYYLHNRIETIYSVAANIKDISPDLEVAVAHGRMKETELERIMLDVSNGSIDVLLCTTIIETGLDIPNVNTIIIEDADRMGLAQLYQLRGRVGRSTRLAYAYLMYNKDKILSDEAQKRLKAISEFTEFGSGFKIALRDLEIRGAGNVVGSQQHGHMDAVGYDLYCKFLGEAINNLKEGTNEPEEVETLVNVPSDAFIPHDYIQGENYRVEMYKKIASIKSDQDAEEMREELVDRYGKFPETVQNLIDIARLKALAESLNVVEIRQVVSEFPGQPISFLFKMREGKGANWTLKTDKLEKNGNIKFLLQRVKELQEFGK